MSFVFFALAKAGTPEAQAALITLMDDPAFQGPDSIRAAIALGAVKDPDERTVAAVDARSRTWEASMAQGEAAEMTTGSATLTLGTWADRQDEHNPELASMLRQDLAERLEESLSMEETCTLLRAVGNTGHDELLATAIAYLEHDDSQVRVDAARALRRMDPDATSELLGKYLPTETNPRARRELCMSFMDQAGAAGVVPPAAVIEAALAQLLVEKDPSARPVLIELIALGAATYPAARAALIALFATEKNAAILKLIGSVIPASELP